MSMPDVWGIAPSTGISRSRKYSPIVGTVFAFVIKEPGCGARRILPQVSRSVTFLLWI